MCGQVLAALMRKKWPCSWCVKSSKGKISIRAAIISTSPDVWVEKWRLWNRQFQCRILRNYFWPQWVQWKCNTLKRVLTHLLPISEMIDHLGCWRRILGKESKCEILRVLGSTTGKGRNQYLFHCSRWVTEGGQTRSGSQRIKICKKSNRLTWESEGSRNKKQEAKDNQGEGMMRRGIKTDTAYPHKTQKMICYLRSFLLNSIITRVLDASPSSLVFYFLYEQECLRKLWSVQIFQELNFAELIRLIRWQGLQLIWGCFCGWVEALNNFWIPL